MVMFRYLLFPSQWPGCSPRTTLHKDQNEKRAESCIERGPPNW